MLVVRIAEDEEVADFVIMFGDITEGWLATQGLAEGNPGGEDLVLGGVGLGDISSGDARQHRVEVS